MIDNHNSKTSITMQIELAIDSKDAHRCATTARDDTDLVHHLVILENYDRFCQLMACITDAITTKSMFNLVKGHETRRQPQYPTIQRSTDKATDDAEPQATAFLRYRIRSTNRYNLCGTR
jgi:hypothetical protein